MSTTFGVDMSVVGVAFVFITLLVVAAAIEVLRRLGGGAVRPEEVKRVRAAAVAAVLCYRDAKEGRRSSYRAPSSSRWSTFARYESMGGRGKRPG